MSADIQRSTVRGAVPPEGVALVDLLDRLLAKGVVVSGDITLSIAGVDLVRVSLRALVTSVDALDPTPAYAHGEGSSQ